MYAETELMYPYLQELGFNFPLGEDYHHHHHQVHLQDEEELLHHLYGQSHLSFGGGGGNGLVGGQYYHYDTQEYLTVETSLLSNTGRTAPCVPVHEFGEEGELFKAPEPEDALPATASGDQHQLAAATCLIPRAETIGKDVLGGAFDDGEMDFLGKIAIEEAFPELADVQFPTLDMGDDQEGLAVGASPMQKSVSCGSLSGKDGSQMPSAVDFHVLDLGASAFGLRRAYSEGDMETLQNGDAAAVTIRPAYERPWNADDAKMAERRQKLSRYRKKKTKRNFDRKIKYACRKALADNQPRVRGRFARTGGRPSDDPVVW